MMIDFTDAELDLIYDALDAQRVISESEDDVNLIYSIFDKICERVNNDS